MTKLEQTEHILNFLLKSQYVKLNAPTLKEILKVDKKFNFSVFDFKKTPIDILYNKNKNTILKPQDFKNGTALEVPMGTVIGFKMNNSDTLETDINIFANNLTEINCFHIKGWRMANTLEYYVKYLPSKTKTFRYVLHSYSKPAHNVENSVYREIEKYYIDGNAVKEDKWKIMCREFKLQRVLK